MQFISSRFCTLASIGLLCSQLTLAQVAPGQIWDIHAQQTISLEAAMARLQASRYVLLGEKHDNEIHHALQLQVLQSLHQGGRKPTLLMEQFDTEHQAALHAAQTAAAGSTKDATAQAERLADAGQLNRKGWRWPMYRDLIAFATAQRWPVAAANLSRAEARDIFKGSKTVTLPTASPALFAKWEADMVAGHCGQALPANMVTGLVTAQRARDATMAAALEATGPQGAVLIAGAGHVRRERAAPLYFQQASSNPATITIAFTEVDPGITQTKDYDQEGFDLLWFTPAQTREDPCAVMPLQVPAKQ
ncbi:ChaN family lipoprotein [Rhodoferax aquaticus]|nr:ChaN family lipoprotein [Rhodoferax aquaticus]